MQQLLMPSRSRTKRKSTTWHGTAFIVEALALLVFLAISIGLLLQIFGVAYERSSDADQIANASFLASNEAERFTADPHEVSQVMYLELINDQWIEVSKKTSKTYELVLIVEPETTSSGILYNATISVSYLDKPVYSLETTTYKSNSGGGVN